MDKKKVLEMRNAIDMIEGALMGWDQLHKVNVLFRDNRDDLLVTVRSPIAQVRRVCDALEECTRIINSEEYSPERLR